MELSGVDLLLTYQCNLECDHCFVWGSPRQSGVMPLQIVRRVLDQAEEMGTVWRVFFEGGEPFLYYGVLLAAVREAYSRGFSVGIVSNGYWATSRDDAREWLRPLAGLVSDILISSDLYHSDQAVTAQSRAVQQAAKELGIRAGVISIGRPEASGEPAAEPLALDGPGGQVSNLTGVGRGTQPLVPGAGQLPAGESPVMFRGRASEKLAPLAPLRPWTEFAGCEYEDLREPGRVHIDPLGYVHVCQGIAIGNVLRQRLGDICEAYHPDSHPVAGPLLAGGPAQLVRHYGLPHRDAYADACHLCYEARLALRDRFPEALAPAQMYGAA